MKRICLLLTSFMLLLSVAAFAQDDVSVRVDGSLTGVLYTGENSMVEFWYTNAGTLVGLSNGFSFTSALAGFGMVADGNEPSAAATKYMHVEAAYTSSFNLPDWAAVITGVPNTFLAGGAAIPPSGLPPHAVSTKVWSLKVSMPADLNDYPAGFCVDNVFIPPAGTWTFDAGAGGFAPTFQGQANPGGEVNPDAPAVCFNIEKRLCTAPAFTATPGGPVNRNHCLTYTFDFDADPNPGPGNTPPATLTGFTTTAGTINPSTGELSVNPLADCGSTDVEVGVSNSCGGNAVYNFTITWTNNNPAITNCGGIQDKVGKGNPVSFDFNATDPDPCDALVWTVVANDPVVNAPTISGIGVFDWMSDLTEGGTTKNFTVTATDPCGAAATCDFAIEVLDVQPFVIHIEKTHNTLQGMFEYVSIIKEAGTDLMGGFDFLVAYDASALSFFSATLGADLGPAGCGWEYFTYRYGAQGNCGGPCPSGLLRVVAIADVNNGANHPSCFTVADGAELVSLKFYVTNDRNFECMYVPIRFAWIDCGDNSISNVGGDTLWISSQVFDFENTAPGIDPNYEITDMSCYFAIAYGGACAACDVSEKYAPIRFILFWNGGVDIVCADSIDARGDVNLNGIAYEIADAVLYTNYFLYGLSALDANPQYQQAQIAASDVNADGIPLSVGDLVYLLRVIVGDALPFPKLAPFANVATVSFNGTLSTDANVEIGGVYATFKANGAYNLTSNSSMKVESAESDGMVKVLVYAGLDNMTNRIDAGSNALFTMNGDVELVDVQVADYNGNLLNTRLNKNVLPTEFKLSQNVPNPFNPTTKIGLDLPTASDWTIDIYNVAGQLVKSFNGRGVGTVNVEWNAASVASGIYFYKATAGNFVDTKKMVLMK